MEENELQKEIRDRIMKIAVVQRVRGLDGRIYNLISREEVLGTLFNDELERMR